MISAYCDCLAYGTVTTESLEARGPHRFFYLPSCTHSIKKSCWDPSPLRPQLRFQCMLRKSMGLCGGGLLHIRSVVLVLVPCRQVGGVFGCCRCTPKKGPFFFYLARLCSAARRRLWTSFTPVLNLNLLVAHLCKIVACASEVLR